MLVETILALALAGLCLAAVLYGIDVQPGTPGQTVLTTTETLVLTSNNVTTPNPNGKASIRAWTQLTVGAGTTSVLLTIYAGAAIGGRIVGTRQADSGDFAPSGTTDFSVEFVDPFNNVSGVQYCLSVMQNGATGNGTIQNALIETKVLSG